jgi:uncharacterized protein involved in outer membrane biogenesis
MTSAASFPPLNPGRGVKLRLRTWLLGFLFVLLLGALASAYVLISKADYVKALLLEEVQHEVGRKIEVGGARLELFPRIRLELSDVVVWDVDPSRRFFTARRVELHLRVFSFFKQRVIAKRLVIEEPKIDLHRDRTGHWNILLDAALPAALPLPGDKGAHSPFALLLLVREISLHGGEARIVDESRGEGARTLAVGELAVAVSSPAGGVPLDLSLSGRVLDTPEASLLRLEGRVSRAPSADRLVQADASSLTSDGFQFDGTTELAAMDLRKLVEFFGPLPAPEGIHGVAMLRGRISVMPGVVGYDMVLSEMRLGIESLMITGQASLAGLMTPQPTFSLTFSAGPIGLGELLAGIPEGWLHPQVRSVVREQEVDGIVEVVNATITGATVPEPRVSVTGEVRVREGRALVTHDRVPVDNLSGTVLIEPDRMKATNIGGSYGAIRVTSGKGTVFFLHPGPWLELEFTGETSASHMIATLAQVATTPGVRKGLTELRDIKGEGQVTYQLAGPLHEPDGVKFLGGEFVFREAEFQSPLAGDRITAVSGRLIGEAQRTRFERFTGRVGAFQFELQGAITKDNLPAFEGVTVGFKGEAEPLIRFLTGGTVRETGIRGALELRTKVSGAVERPRFSGVADLQEAALSLPGYLEKPAGSPARLEFEAGLEREQVLAFKQVALILSPLRLDGKGTVRLGTPFGLDATLLSGPIALGREVPRVIPMLEHFEGGTLEVTLDIKGRGTRWNTWQYSGWVALTDGVIAVRGLDHPAKAVYLRLKLDRNGGAIKRLAFKLLDSDVAMSGTVRNWLRAPIINVNIESSDFDLDLVVPKGARSPFRDFLEDLAASSRVAASVSVDRGRYKELMIEGLSAQISAHDGLLEMNRIAGEFDGKGELSARLVLKLPKGKPADGEVVFRIADLSTARFLRLLGDDKRLIVGDLTADGTLGADGANPKGVLASLNGKVDFFVKKGRIQRGVVLPKLLTILHLGSVLQGRVDLAKDGLPFDKISGALTVRDGLMTADTLIVDSPILKMSYAGTYDLAADELDAVLVASPLGPYAQALKSIPLFGKLFAGERQGVDTAIFEVKGTLDDPKVEYLPLRSLATGVGGLAQFAFDVLKNLVLLPKALIPSGEGEPSPEPPSPTTP